MLRFEGALFAVAGLALAACGAAPGDQETIGTTSSAITFPNDQPAFAYFVGKGLTPFQAAGIVGNLDQESGVDPTAVQGGGPGRGIAQWSVGGRWDTDTNDNATAYASMEGQPLLSLQLQLDFIWYELTTFSEYGLTDLQQTTNVTDATIAFETDFEGCGTCDQATRIAYAQNVLNVFGPGGDAGGGVADASGSGQDSGIGSACTVTSTGESGECLDTSVCAAMAGHISTPGFCPGPDDEQCCTLSPDAAIPKDATDAAADSEGGANHVGGHDAGDAEAKSDSGAHPVTTDADASGSRDDGSAGEGGHARDAGVGSGGGGCSISNAATTNTGGELWLVGFAWLTTSWRTRRRRR